MTLQTLVCLCREENLSLPLFFSLLPSRNEGWIQQLTLQLFSNPIRNVALQTRHVELLITSILTLALFWLQFSGSDSGLFKSFIWENEVLPLRKEELQDCAYSS